MGGWVFSPGALGIKRSTFHRFELLTSLYGQKSEPLRSRNPSLYVSVCFTVMYSVFCVNGYVLIYPKENDFGVVRKMG